MGEGSGGTTSGRDPLLMPLRATPAHDLERLYVDHHRRLRSLAASITFDRSVADEIVHDAFAALAPRLPEVRNHEAYLQRSVVNLAISHVRRRERARRLPVHRVEHTSIPEVDGVWDALATLSARQRAVVVLRFYEDLSYDHIAEVLGVPIGSVKSTLHRALAALEEQL